MARRRFFVPEIRNGHAELEGDEAKHLTQVIRVETGQIYELSDNENVYLAEVTTARKASVVFTITERLPAPAPGTQVTLLVSLIRFERLETIIEKATELGVTEIRLVKAERSEKGLEVAAPKRMHRWQRIALEASQQSRRARLPEITGPITVPQAIGSGLQQSIFLDEERTGKAMLEAVQDAAPTALLIGPEGGWAAHERHAAVEAGWIPVSLGDLVLRTETAAIAALATLNAVFQRERA